MMQVRVRAPDGMVSFSHQGHPIELEGGAVMIDERHLDEFAAHGFRKVDDGDAPSRLAPPPAEIRQVLADDQGPADPRRRAVIGHLSSLPTDTLEMLADVANGKLRVVTQDDASAADDVREPAPPTVTPSIPADGKLTEEKIGSMTKPQMTAWLKARDVLVASSADTDTLRAKVRHASGVRLDPDGPSL